jgi:ribosomal protein L11 methylase PrmA
MMTMKIILPYVESPIEKVEKMVEWADVQSGQKSVDLGAGDGRVMIAMARAGAEAHGFENVEKYVRRAKKNIALAGLHEKAFVSNSDFWKEDLSQYDIVTFYVMAAYMQDLEKKLSKELRPGTKVISNGFPLPEWKELKADDHLYLYKISSK